MAYKMLIKLTPAVNFINIFLCGFFVRTSFQQLFLVTFWLWRQNFLRKKRVKMLTKLTPDWSKTRRAGRLKCRHLPTSVGRRYWIDRSNRWRPKLSKSSDPFEHFFCSYFKILYPWLNFTYNNEKDCVSNFVMLHVITLRFILCIFVKKIYTCL